MNTNGLRHTSITVVLLAMLTTCALASEPVDCFYAARVAKKDSQGGIARHARCLVVQRDSSIRILPPHLRALDFDSNGLATLVIEKGRWFYVKRNGRSIEVLPFDNGADYFVEGLVRGRRNGKIAFFDHAFRMVIQPRYDFAWPFEEGLAEVCSGCREVAEGEHRTMTGGVWGYIDRRGHEVVEVKFTRDEAARRRAQRRP
ncbi:MAG: hypothetical protein QOK37_3093 [Thermoanaerobaculia bacterium]|jgi:hypothetical protein|nr:hypothetical protein [Thermoanaerobaculia bacterium]